MANKRREIISLPMPYLPEIIMEQILQKLPYDAMARSKSVCKTWNSIISSPKFLGDDQLIFSYYNYRRRELFFYASIYSNLVDDTLSLSPISPLDIPIRWACWGEIQPRLLGTYNGLVAISLHNRLILWNPLTNKHSIANVDIFEFESNFESRVLLGLCYDGNKDEYSVVIASDYQSPPASPSNFENVVGYGSKSVCLYNFKDGSVRDIDKKWINDREYVWALDIINLLDKKLFDGGVGKVVCGVPHWVVKHNDGEKPFVETDILYFDLNEERFKKMGKPIRNSKNKIIIGLTMLDGEKQLGFVLHDVVDDILDVWVMKEYGKAESWNNLFRFSYSSVANTFGTDILSMDIMGVLSSGELLVFLNDKKFWAYSIKRGHLSRKIKLQDKDFCSIITYRPKLISPPKSIAKKVSESLNNISECPTGEYEDDTY